MRGDLSETAAADACRQLARGGASGVLAIDGPEGPGTITLVAGRIVGATSPIPRARLGDRLVGAGFLDEETLAAALDHQRASGAGSRLGALLVERALVPHDAVRLFVQEQTLDAVLELQRWRYGSFAFDPGPVAGIAEIPVAMAVDDVLNEIARRQTHWDELSRVIPDLAAVPHFRDDPASPVSSLEPDEFAVLANIDGDRSVRRLAADLGYGEFDLARIVYGLALLGIVDIRLPEDEIGAALDDAMAYRGHEPLGAEVAAAPEPEPAVAAEPEPWVFAAPEIAPEPEPPAQADDVEFVTDLPESSFSDVLREFRSLDAARFDDRPDAAPNVEASAEPQEPEEPPRADDDASGRSAAARPPRGDRDGDVAEFLRELSRLALDEEPEPERPRRNPTPSSAPRDDDKKGRRRGLFGRG